MLKKVTDKTCRIIGSVRKWMDERRKERLRRKWENAEDYLENMPYNSGILCMYDGKFKKAVKYFKKAVEDDSEGSLAWYMLGEAYWEMGMIEEARANYLKAWSYRDQIKSWYVSWKELSDDIREALVRSGAVAKERDADSL